MWFKRIISTKYTGLCNRLEGLALCFAYEALYGHRVCLDWPDAELLQVEGARSWKYTPLDKWMGTKVRDPSPEVFHRLGNHRILIQRGTMGGDLEIQDRMFQPTIARLRLHPKGRSRLITHFSDLGNALLVGVHIRRGDFQDGDPEIYDIHAKSHPRVPLWWYEYAMERMRDRYGSVVFFLSHNNRHNAEEARLRSRFDILPSLADGRYNPGGGHASFADPVIDLFSLSCCPIVITTPLSTFSHFAANVLGPSSLAIQPLPFMRRQAPGLCFTRLFGQRSTAWFTSLLEETAFQSVGEVGDLPNPSARIHLNWL